MHIIDIPYENQYKLQTIYRVLTNSYSTFKVNQVLVELVSLLQRKLTDILFPSTQLTIQKAVVLHSLALKTPMKCKYCTKYDT